MTNTSPVNSSEVTRTQTKPCQADSKTSSDEMLVITMQAWVLRLMADPKSKPAQVLNALRRLEMLKEFPWRMEKQARMLALAEAQVDLRRRALALREAQLNEKLEKREAAAAKASAKAAKVAAKAQPSAPKPGQVTAAVPVSAPVASVAVAPVAAHKVPGAEKKLVAQQIDILPHNDWKLMPLTNKAFGPMLIEQLRKAAV